MRIISYFAGASVLLSLAGLCLISQAQTGRTHQGSFAGTVARSPEGGKANFVGQMGGDLPGYLMLTLDYDSNRSIHGGNWTLIITKRKADGSSGEEGRMDGTLSGGSVTLNRDGQVISVNAARLTIKSGRGTYDGVVNGDGTFDATSVSGKPSPFDGLLTLTF